MQDLNDYLVQLADRLDQDGKVVCANAVDDLIQSNSLVKVAQYVGVIGYVLKQNRAMGNCIRKKRASSDQPMQEIVLGCLKEYQDGQDYNDTEWHSKYAQVISDRPTDFNNLHLELIAQWGSNDEIENHISNVEDTMLLLSENNVQDETMKRVLSHVESLGSILRKESSHPFKLAAPPSPRGFWSRIMSPSEFSWLNPMSWKGRWQRGEDKDVILEMDRILESIRRITLISQRMKTNIYRLKNQVAGYLVGSTTDLPDNENPQVAKNIADKIRMLDAENWNKNILATQQLRHLLNSSFVQNSYNYEHVRLANNLVSQLTDGIQSVYQQIDDIQNNMDNLRQRTPIRGRNFGLTEEGESNPFAMTSPAEEFGVLEQVLSRIYQNPFDEAAHQYAQRMHARLDDKLRYIQQPKDESVSNWLQGTPEDPDIPNPVVNESGEQATPDSTESSSPSTPQPDLPPEQLEKAVQDLVSIPSGMNSEADKAEFIAKILNTVFSYYSNNGRDGNVDSLINALLNVGNQGSNATEVPQNPVETPSAEPQVVNEHVVTPESPAPLEPETPVTSTPEPSTPEPEPESIVSTEDKVPEPEAPPQARSNDEQDSRRRSRRSRSRRSSRARESIQMLPEVADEMQQKSMPAYASVFDVIKIADALDNIDPSLVEIIDQYLLDQEDIMFELPRFPSSGRVIQEEDTATNT